MNQSSEKQKVLNCLYISYDGMTDPLGQSQVLPYLIGLSKHAIKFHLISFEKKERYSANEATIRSICQKANIEWHPLTYTKKPPLLSTMYDLWRMKRLAYRLHRKHSFEIAHCRSYVAALAGLSMKKRYGTKFLFDMRGFWADERIDGGIWKLDNPLFKFVYSFFKRKEKEFLIEADHTISLTYAGKKEIESWFKASDFMPLITVIPCCVDLALFKPSSISADERNSLQQALKISPDSHVLGYVGSIGTWYMLPEMLDYFSVLLKTQPNAIFLFVTQEAPETLLKAAKTHNIPEETIRITACNHNMVPLHISLFSASIFFIRPSYSKKASSPTKLGELMAMGIPVVCNAGVGDTDTIVSEYSAGKIVALDALNHISEDEIISFPFDQHQTQEGAQTYFGLENGVQKYLGVYRSLC